eukprot:TRINITY_DN1353_c0_g2_i17.p1 TRINITY_DN1353_c0_g2~~TRINITY_DN1353_c0_g2_i17.p1  ORF type:complete len:187 (+),score=54.48 TRINITY_DN1353_c0_g2_i17:2681-3241(+)
MEILPSTSEFGKDMGIWHISWILPQMVSPIISGLLIDKFGNLGKSIRYAELGYTVAFIFSAFGFVGGVFCVSRIQMINRKEGQALDVFFNKEGDLQLLNDPSEDNIINPGNDEVMSDLSSTSDSPNLVEPSFPANQISTNSTTNITTAHDEETSFNYSNTGVKGLDDFMRGRINLEEIEFEDESAN